MIPRALSGRAPKPGQESHPNGAASGTVGAGGAGESRKASSKPRVVTYDYRDEQGTLLYQVQRFEPGFKGEKKTFRQRRPNGKGWVHSLGNVRRVLYRLPELLAADPSRLVFVCEGEKDVDTLLDLGLVATTNAQGAGKWRPEYSPFLAGRPVVILPDNDRPGREHARQVAEALKNVAASVGILELPGLPEKADVTDWLGLPGNTKESLLQLVQAPPADGADASPPQTSKSPPAGRAKPTQAEVLLGLAQDHLYFHAADGRAYAAVLLGEGPPHRETLPVRSNAFRQVLARDYFRYTGKAVSTGVMQDVLGVLEARARFDGEQRDVGIRVVQAGDRVYLDLADERWRAVEVRPEGWQVLAHPPVHFRRPRGMLPLPAPQRGGSLDLLRPLVNVATDQDWRLLLVWLVQATYPAGPYPLLNLHGEQGSAKSTTGRMLRGLIDPNIAPLRSAPRDERDLVIAATNSWLLALDNLSDLPPWLSDALCRLATGGGYATRELYTDMEEVILDVQRPILLNGIEELSSRPDLLDRSIVLTLPALGEADRLPESEVWGRYKAVQPHVLGALLDLLSGALRQRGKVRPIELPRMADFGLLGGAVERTLGWPEGAFATAYTANRDEQIGTALDASIIYPYLRVVVPAKSHWEGTAADLLALLNREAGERVKARGWPSTARVLSGMLRRLAPTLRRAGITVEFTRAGRARQRLVRITNETEHQGKIPSASSALSAATDNPGPGRTQADTTADGGTAPPSYLQPQSECGADGADDADGEMQGCSVPNDEERGDAWEG
ncbi:MAG: hypothetical protein L0Z62_18620 [Gemmataceae bacterium]|nr:hypothetical protein [Gemmataceae bacterium]